MANRQDAIDAAKKQPQYRSPREQALVDQNKGDQAVRNADHAARRDQRVYGK